MVTHTLTALASDCTSTLDGLTRLPFQCLPDGTLAFTFNASVGLYQFSAIADASAFDWDELYFDLDSYGNIGQRTGPWDFNLLDKNKPLVPSYWVSINEEPIGLWFFQRVSLEDIDARRFRGRAAFWVREAGEVTLEFRPYRLMNLTWSHATLEADPEDELNPAIGRNLVTSRLEASQWGGDEFWERQRERLATSHSIFRAPLVQAFDWLRARQEPSVTDLPLLIAAWRLDDCEIAAAQILPVLDAAIDVSHWGNPDPEGYGHDGDMVAAMTLRALAWAYHALRPTLGPAREAKLLAKLKVQGERFLNLALLNRDYWGGSVMQDHGRISLAAFGTAALHLVGHIPEATQWLSYAMPRIERSNNAMPRDGVIPLSSYCSLPAYLDEMTNYRDALLALLGDDIFDQGPFLAIVDYIVKVLREDELKMIVPSGGGDQTFFFGGNAFLNRMATKYNDGRAAYLQRLMLQDCEFVFYHPVGENAYYNGVLSGFLTYDPDIPPAQTLPETCPLQFFEDSGLVHYHDRIDDVVLAARCGPFLGYHSDRQAKGSCDRLGGPPGAGHFILAVKGQPLLSTPDWGYSLHAGLCTCLLIDGRGQTGDIGYPMSIPSRRDTGEEIEFARWDPKQRSGWIRLNLQPAYSQSLGVIVYYRDLLLQEGKSIVCRDRIVLEDALPLSWLFQGKRQEGIVIESDCAARFGHGPSLRVEAVPLGFALETSVQDTQITWSHRSASGFQPFSHLRFDSVEAVSTATVDFVLTWK